MQGEVWQAGAAFLHINIKAIPVHNNRILTFWVMRSLYSADCRDAVQVNKIHQVTRLLLIAYRVALRIVGGDQRSSCRNPYLKTVMLFSYEARGDIVAGVETAWHANAFKLPRKNGFSRPFQWLIVGDMKMLLITMSIFV